MCTEDELDPFEDYKKLRANIALEVDKLVRNPSNRALFRHHLKSFLSKSRKYVQGIVQNKRSWEAAMAEPKLRDKNAGPPGKEYEWKDHELFGKKLPPTKEHIKELRKIGFKDSLKDAKCAYKENRWGYWRRKFNYTQDDPFMRFIPDATLNLEMFKVQDKDKELEFHFLLLAVLHDNEIQGCIRIDNGKWQDNMYERIYRLLYGDYGDKSKLLQAALYNVTNHCESSQKSKPQGKDRQSKNWHNDDFTEVVWNGKKYKFGKPQQSLSVKYLWNNKRAREKSIGEAIGSEADNFRLSHIFRQKSKTTKMHPAWGTMIVHDGKGIYSLAESKKAPKK